MAKCRIQGRQHGRVSSSSLGINWPAIEYLRPSGKLFLGNRIDAGQLSGGAPSRAEPPRDTTFFRKTSSLHRPEGHEKGGAFTRSDIDDPYVKKVSTPAMTLLFLSLSPYFPFSWETSFLQCQTTKRQWARHVPLRHDAPIRTVRSSSSTLGISFDFSSPLK